MQNQSQLISKHVTDVFGSKLQKNDSNKYEMVHDGKICLELKFIPDDEGSLTTLHVSNLFECNVNDLASHAESLGLINRLAESIPFVQRITLRDASHVIVCDEHLQLNLLHILTTGKSWYNSFGYKSVDHDENVAHNALTMNKTIDAVFARYANSRPHDDFTRSIANPRKELFPELPTTMTVAKYVKAVFDSVRSFPETKDKCITEQRQKALFLKGLIHYLDRNHDLKYNLELIKRVEHKGSPKGGSVFKKYGGNKRSRNNKRSRSNKRSRRS